MERAYLGVACGGAEAGVVWARLVELVAQVRPGAGAVTERGVHDGGVKLLDSGVWANGASERGAGVSVRASDGNLEVGLVLAVVDSGLAVESSTPERALDVGKGGRVTASTAGLLNRIAFEENVPGD
jgi:hypothetical protein